MHSYNNDTSTERVQSCRALINTLKQKLSERNKLMNFDHIEFNAKKVIDSVQGTPKTHDRYEFSYKY